MQVRNKETGEIETLRHGPATDAVTAGTHEFVNIDGKGEPKSDKAKSGRPSAELAAARKAVTEAEKALKAAKSDAEKAKANDELKAAKDALAALEA